MTRKELHFIAEVTEAQDGVLVELHDKPLGPQGSNSPSPPKCPLTRSLQTHFVALRSSCLHSEPGYEAVS